MKGTRKYTQVSLILTNFTSLNVQINVSFFNTSSKFIERIDPAIDDSVVATTWMPGRSSSITLSRPRENFWQQTYIVRLVLTSDASENKCHLQKVFLPTKKRITACWLLREAFNGNNVIFNAYKWRQDVVIIIKLTAGTRNEIPYKTYISDFS